MNVRRGRMCEKKLHEEFRKHFGSSPLDIGSIWYDLCNWDETLLPAKEKSEKGFTRFLAAVHWLWTYPKNAEILASRFGLCKDYVQGKHLEKWIDRIAYLAAKKIKWDNSLDSSEAETFLISADGVDCKLWERKHPRYPVDRKAMSHKFKSCGAKYLVVLAVSRPKVVFIAGPFRGGKHDLAIFRDSGLIDKLKQLDKVCIADRGFRPKSVAEQKHFSLPDYMDSPDLHNFKSRVRLRLETYNRRVKHFEALSNTFRHGFDKHGKVFIAINVIVQYQMDNGSPVFAP